MAHKKAQGAVTNGRSSNPQYLGVKLYAGQEALAGSIIVRQRGTKILPGKNVQLGKDHTIFSLIKGLVFFSAKRKKNFDGTTSVRKVANVIQR